LFGRDGFAVQVVLPTLFASFVNGRRFFVRKIQIGSNEPEPSEKSLSGGRSHLLDFSFNFNGAHTSQSTPGKAHKRKQPVTCRELVRSAKCPSAEAQKVLDLLAKEGAS
jgi:hypothetical protein